MAVKARLDLELGTSQFKSQMKTVDELAKQSTQNFLKSEAAKTTALQREHSKREQEYNKLFREQERAEQAATRVAQREAEKRERIAQQERVNRLRAAGHIAESMGFFRTGHVLRGASSLGVGVDMSAGGLLAATVALGAVGLAAGLVEKAFSTLTGAATQLATSIVGAVSQIGGARNLQDMFIESASAERIAAQISANVIDKVTPNEVLGLINRVSGSTEFTPGEVGAGFSAFKARTGTFGPLRELAPFMANLASVGGLTTEQSGGLLGQISTQFPGLNTKQIQQVAMNLWGLGRAGAVELGQATDVTQALGFAGKTGLGAVKGINLEMGLVQLAQRFTGGQNAEQAVTGIRRLQEELLLSPGSKKSWKLQQMLGGDFLTHDDTGQLVFKNVTKSLAKLALSSYEGKVPTTLIEERGQKALMGITTSLSSQFTPGMSEESKLKIIEDVFEKLKDSAVAIDEFDGALKDIKNTAQYKLKESFNEISISLEKIFLPLIKEEIVPAMQKWAAWFQDPNNIDQIKTFFDRFITEGTALINLLPDLSKAMLGLVIRVANLLPGGSTVEGHLSSSRSALANAQIEMGYLQGPGLEDLRKKQQEVIDKAKSDVDFWESLFKAEHPSVVGAAPTGNAGKARPGEGTQAIPSILDLLRGGEGIKLHPDSTINLSDETISRLTGNSNNIPFVDNDGRNATHKPPSWIFGVGMPGDK